MIVPLVLLVPSTLSTGIGFGSLLQGIRCLITNFESMNCPSAPESIRADVGMCFSCASLGGLDDVAEKLVVVCGAE